MVSKRKKQADPGNAGSACFAKRGSFAGAEERGATHVCRAAIALALTARSLLRDENVLIHLLCQEIHAIISKRDCRIMAGYFRLIPALRHPSFTQRKNSVFLCTRICGAGTKFALEAICLMKVRYFLVTIAVCLMLSVCSGCYGTAYDRSIPAMAYPSGNVLEISTGAELNPGTYIAYGANQFSADLSLSALVQRIYRDDAAFQIVSMPAQRNIGTLIWVPQGNGTRQRNGPEYSRTDAAV